MADPHVFSDPAITVRWSKRRCIHTAECVMRLQEVFEPGRKPWITPEASNADTIAEVITHCPTGALQFERHDGGAAEVPDAEVTVRVMRHGPLHVRGELALATPDGAVVRETRVALCRCGQSRNKPFCDNSHRDARFRDAGDLFEGRIGAAAAPGGAVRITARPNGPLRLNGPFALVSADGRVRVSGGEVALCRCGMSRNKPFCDSSHKESGFEAPGLEPADPAGPAPSVAS